MTINLMNCETKTDKVLFAIIAVVSGVVAALIILATWQKNHINGVGMFLAVGVPYLLAAILTIKDEIKKK